VSAAPQPQRLALRLLRHMNPFHPRACNVCGKGIMRSQASVWRACELGLHADSDGGGARCASSWHRLQLDPAGSRVHSTHRYPATCYVLPRQQAVVGFRRLQMLEKFVGAANDDRHGVGRPMQPFALKLETEHLSMRASGWRTTTGFLFRQPISATITFTPALAKCAHLFNITLCLPARTPLPVARYIMIPACMLQKGWC
jgi:hypothetical protein